jgi:hypothetical protein
MSISCHGPTISENRPVREHQHDILLHHSEAT